MRRIPLALSLAAATCLLAPGIALALTVENISLERMTRESHTIVYGTVLSSHAEWEGKNIYTYTTIQVRESLKGARSASLTVKQLGGTVGDVGQEVSGTPRLRQGEDVVLFLIQWQGAYWVHSIVLGKFSIVKQDGGLVAFNDLNNIGLIDPVTKREITQANQKSNHIPLGRFLDEVRSFVNR